tara:strand:+ start:197 stop:649 length:453 start_codon:yes stop_codon:yes gene_type:complete
MINAIRIILLVIALGVISLAGFYFYKVQNYGVDIEKIKVKIMGKGVDLEVENMEITHEVKGNPDWIIKAVLAQVNNKENITNLKGVEVIIPKGQNRSYVITAESGTYQNTSKDIDLVGNVKLTGDVGSLASRFNTKNSKSSNTSLSQEKK